MTRPRTAATTALAVLALAGCSTRPVQQEDATERLFALTADWPAFAQGPNGEPPTGQVDVLFMVDNSSSMTNSQQKLAAGFDSFMSAIDALPGGTPDLHIGVVSSDMGAGNGAIPGCNPPLGDAGRLQSTPRGACTATTLEAGASFIALRTDPVTGERIANYTGALPDVFSCIALLGDQGCGFEQPLSSVRHALDPALAPPENAGFLRPNAFLAVILISNEDDCSAPADTDLFDTTSTSLASPLGPLGNFRCSEFGHLCLVDGKLRPPPRDRAATYAECQSNEHGKLESVAEFVSFLRRLKGDPAKVFLATVAGPTDPYAIHQKAATIPVEELWPEPGHSCTATDGSYADPAVRLAQVTRLVGPRGRFASICGDSMDDPLHEIAAGLVGPLAPACVPPPTSHCTVVDRWVGGDRVRQAVTLPACANRTEATPCWSLVDDAACAANMQRLVVDRTGTTVPSGLVTAIDCSGQAL